MHSKYFIKNSIRSYGQKDKIDEIDVIALASYGYERQIRLKPFKPNDSKQNNLRLLEEERRQDLKQMLGKVGEI